LKNRLADTSTEILAFIDAYSNTQDLHSSLNYRSPASFESETALAN
jgi:transposase InsO family protein